MNSLNELIGLEVEFDVCKDHDKNTLSGTVESVSIEDWHFEANGEPIYITVFVRPDEKSYNEVANGVADYDLEETLTDYFAEIPLENIRKA